MSKLLSLSSADLAEIRELGEPPRHTTGGIPSPRDGSEKVAPVDLSIYGTLPDPSPASVAGAFGEPRATDDDTNPKDRLGVKKPPLSLVPMVAVIYESFVFAHGAAKYGEFNWRRKNVRRRVYLEAILRHTIAALAGENVDSDSGMPHEAHIRACAAIILDAKECGALKDDRFERDESAKLIARLTAGDYHNAAASGTRTPALTLDEITQSWADAANKELAKK